jgi:Concanavalin A-like lectin/glucanases superfamily
VPTYPPGAPAGESNARAVRTVDPAPPLLYRDYVLADGPSNYWRLGELSGLTAVDSVGGVNGTISGGVTLGQSGAVANDKAMAFNGTTGKILTAAPVPIPLVCTIEGWINYQSASQPEKNFFVTRTLAGATGDTVAVGTSGVATGVLAATVGAGAISAIGTVPVVAGRWHHCVYVMDGSTIAFYLNGVFDRTQPFVRTTPSGGPGQIGFDPGVFAYLGSIDEIAIYPKALTAQQIAAHFRAYTLASYPPGPIPNAGESNPRAVA